MHLRLKVEFDEGLNDFLPSHLDAFYQELFFPSPLH